VFVYLIYLDESGNSGLNLNDPQQPLFMLCAMVVEEVRWQSLEYELKSTLDRRMPGWRTTKGFEVHGADIRTGNGVFSGMPVAERIALRDEWMQVGAAHGVRLIQRSVRKKPFAQWLAKEFGGSLKFNPHVAAFALLSRCIDNYLTSLPGQPLGMLISDENKEIVTEVENAITALRGLEGTLRLSRIVEKGFFIDSSKSLPLQLCDLYTLSLRKRYETLYELAPAKPFDQTGIEIAMKLVWTDHQHDKDVIEWLKIRHAEPKKEAARG
jgi:hypothetical protein